MVKMSFKEYLESKEKLRRVIDNTPVQETFHEVTKYCNLTAGEDKDSKFKVPLKPKQRLVVEWTYYSLDNPEITNIKIVNEEGEDEEFDTHWTTERLDRWLIRNTKKSRFTKVA